MSCVSNEEIEKAREQLEKIRGDKELMHRILLQELAERDEITALAKAEEKGMANAKSEGIKEGVPKGEVKKAKETAQKMLKKGMEIEMISEITGLSREENENLD